MTGGSDCLVCAFKSIRFTLTCGHSICLKCNKECIKNKSEFVCPSCLRKYILTPEMISRLKQEAEDGEKAGKLYGLLRELDAVREKPFDGRDVFAAKCDKLEQNINTEMAEYRAKRLAQLESSPTQLELAALAKQAERFSAEYRSEMLKSGSELEAALSEAGRLAVELKSVGERARNEALSGQILALRVNPDGEKVCEIVDEAAEVKPKPNESGTRTQLRDIRVQEKPSLSKRIHAVFLSQVLFLLDARLATCSRDETIRVWNIEKDEELFELRGHTEWVLSLASLPNDYLASGAADGSIKIWDLERREEIRTIRAHSDAVLGLRTLSNGRLASYSPDDTVKIWNLFSASEAPLATFRGHGKTYYLTPYSLFDVTPAGRVVTSSRLRDNPEPCLLRVWSPEQPEEPVATVSTLMNAALSLLVLSNGQIALGFYHGAIKIVDLVDEARSRLVQLAHGKDVYALVELSNGSLLSAGRDAGDRTIKLWSLVDLSLLQTVVTGHTAEMLSISVSPDERLLVTSSWNTEIKLWSLSIGDFESRPESTSANSSELAVSFTNLSRNVKAVQSQQLIGHSKCVRMLTLLRRNRLISCSDDALIKVWDFENSRLLIKFTGHLSSVNALTLLSNGRLASGSSDGTINIWDLEQRELVKTLAGHSKSVVSLFALKNGNLASCSIDGTICVWDLESESNSPKYEIKGESIALLGVFSTDNLLTWSDKQDRKAGGALKLWNHETGLEIKSYNHRLMRPTSFLVLQNDHVAVGFEDGRVKVIVPDVRMALLASKGAHIGAVASLLELPNGNLVSGGRDSVVKIWSSTDGRVLLSILTSHTGAVTSLALSADAYRLFTGSEDTTIRSWTSLKLTEDPSPSMGEYRCLTILEQNSCSRTLLLSSSKSLARSIGKEMILSQKSVSDSSKIDVSIRSLKELSHGSIVRLTECLDRSSSSLTVNRKMLLLVYENYSEWLSLENYLSIKPAKYNAFYLNDFHTKAIKWLVQLADALAYLHAKNLVHGNLSIRNLFLESETTIKLDVPDLAGELLDGERKETRLEDMRYFSPQRIKGNKSMSPKDDSWSFGCILYEMIERKRAFGGLNFHELPRSIVDGNPPELTSNEIYKPLCLKLWEKQEEQRLGFKEIKEQLEAIKNEMILDESNLDDYLSEKETEPQRAFKYQFIDYDCFERVSRTEELNLSHNEFTSIQERHFDCLPIDEADEILRLDLSFNKLEIIEDAFWRLVNLRTLDLSNNRLEELPVRVFSALTSLKLLDLSRNCLRVLESSLFQYLSGLDALNLSGNCIESIETDLFLTLFNLQALDLGDNKIEKLRFGVFGSQFSLTRLRLDGNRIDSIESDLFVNTTKLLNLRLDHNQISSISSGSFRNLINLRHLDLSFNQIDQVDGSLFSSLEKLKTLNLASNQLESIKGVQFDSMKQLSQLQLNKNKLQTIDLDSFSQLTRLRELNLSDNCFSAIDIGSWKTSRSLEIDASGNEILLGDAQLALELESNNIHLTFDHIKPIRRAY